MAKAWMSMGTLAPLLWVATLAYAAPPSTELTVTGELVVPLCTVAAADEGIYDLGKIPATMIKPNAETVVTALTKNWTITCDAETYLSLTPSDNRASSSTNTGTGYFGLGNVNGSGKIGTYTVDMMNGTVDGIKSNLYVSATAAISPQASVPMHKGYRNGWAATTNLQKSGKIFAADFKVTPVLASSLTMNGPVTEDTNIDGSMTLNFAFGI